MLLDESSEPVELAPDGREVEESAHQFAVIGPAPFGERRLVGRVGRRFVVERPDGVVADDAPAVERCPQHDALQAAATAQGHVDLPVRERSGRVDDRPVEREALALVDRDGPRRPERVLAENALDLFRNRPALRVDDVFGVGPFGGLHDDGIASLRRGDFYALVGERRDDADLPVVVAFLRRRVVFDEHDLSALPQLQRAVRRIEVFRKVALDLRFEGVLRRLQRFEPGFVDRLGRAVVRGQRDVAFPVGGFEARNVPLVEGFERRRIDSSVAYPVQQFDETVVLLPVDALQLDGDKGRLPQGFRSEEIGRVVEPAQQPPLFVAHDGGELTQVADHEQLYAAERLASVAVAPQRVADGVEHVGPHHADFVDNEQVDAPDDADFLAAEAVGFVFASGRAAPFRFGHVGGEGELEERVDRHAARMESGYAGRRHNDHPFGRAGAQLAQERGLARSRLAGQKNVRRGLLYEAQGQIELRIIHRSGS